MTYRRAKSQSKKETRHKYISFIRVLAKLKYVLLFFCRNQKLKASNEKRSGIIRETLSEKAAKVLGRCKTTPAQKQNKTRSLTYCYKNERSAISKQPKSASQNTPFCPFSKGAQNCKNHIELIICALQTIFCIFAFLRFCVLNFNCEMGCHRKGQSSRGKANRGVQ